MAESFDSATSNLLCSENNSTCFDDDDDDLECNGFVNGVVISPFWDHINPNLNNLGSVSFMCFVTQSEEIVKGMVERETEHLPRDDYLMRLRSGDLDLSVRRDALDWIWKAHAYCGFGPLSLCLSVNYLDRFLSVSKLPRGLSWTVQLLAVACLSLAAKMEEVNMPHSVDLQVGEPKFVFEAKTIQKMELLILTTLGWKMRALTPCSFIDYFIAKITGEEHPDKSSISRSVQLILSIIRGIDFLEFKPSEIAAAVAVSVLRELPAQEIDKTITDFFIVNKDSDSVQSESLHSHAFNRSGPFHLDQPERVLKCVELIKDLSLIKVAAKSATFVPQSPVRVLDGGCMSYKSDELTVGSCPNSLQNSPNTKRSKSDEPSSKS